MDDKTGKKTAPVKLMASPRSGSTIPTGNHAKNTGGKKGRSGRPPLAFKNFIAQLRQDPTVQAELEKTLKDSTSKAYAAALRVIVDYDDELPSNLSREERESRVAELLREAKKRA